MRDIAGELGMTQGALYKHYRSKRHIFDCILSALNQNTMRFVTNGVVLTKLNPQFIGLLGAAAVAMNM